MEFSFLSLARVYVVLESVSVKVVNGLWNWSIRAQSDLYQNGFLLSRDGRKNYVRGEENWLYVRNRDDAGVKSRA